MNPDPLSPKLRKYMNAVDAKLSEAGEEPLVRAGILRDLEGQLVEMKSVEGMTDDAVLSAIVSPEEYVGSNRPGCAANAESVTEQQIPPNPSSFWITLSYFSAVVALLAIVVEMVSHSCAGFFFDPMPSRWHFVGLLPIPVILAITAYKLRQGIRGRDRPVLCFANGYLMLVSFGYTVAFIQVVPGAIVAIIAFGAGLLPLSPLFAFISALYQGGKLFGRDGSGAKKSGLWQWWLAGLSIAVIIFGGWELHRIWVTQSIEQAIGGDAESAKEGLNSLRWLRGKNILLEYCYPTSQRLLMITEPRQFPREACQTLYFRLTGKDYRESPKPRSVKGARGGWLDENWSENFVADSEVGSDSAGAMVSQLALQSSSMDVSITGSPDGADAGSCVAYAELTLEFLNDGEAPREARCQIILPPGGVAGRLTLWIDGEEREAAFGSRKAVREAYSQVAVVQRRDPALLTTVGADRVLLQCFPVLPGKSMKVKAGFTIPLIPDGKRMMLQMPFIAERNFSVTDTSSLAFWAESRAKLSGNIASLRDEVSASSEDPHGKGSDESGLSEMIHVLRGSVTPSDLVGLRLYADSPTPGSILYGAENSGVFATSAVREAKPFKSRILAVVLDASASMKDLAKIDWQSALSALPDSVKVAFFAGERSTPPLQRSDAIRGIQELVKKIPFAGADEQMPNLEKAWDLCAGESNGLVLWIHGTMPVQFMNTAGIEQRLRRRPGSPESGNPRIASLQINAGPNRFEERLSSLAGFFRVPVVEPRNMQQQLASIFSKALYPNLNDKELVMSLAENTSGGTSPGSPHIVRVAFAKYIMYALQANDGKPPEKLVETAIALRLVTPATGAVVLESQEQYKAHDLDPAANPSSVPVIPEPEEWALIIISLFLLVLLYWKRRTMQRSAIGRQECR